jgi:hypothetical protein
MLFIISQLFFLIVILTLLYLLTWFLPTDSPWAPWWSTSAEVSRRLGKLVKIKKGDIFYELGSGTGTTIFIIAKEFGARVVGIESDWSRVIWSRFKFSTMKPWDNEAINHRDTVTILQKSFFDVDLSPATIVYLYLVPRVIKKLQPKLLKELKPGTKVVSYIYQIDYLPLVIKDEMQQLYVYKIPEKRKK